MVKSCGSELPGTSSPAPRFLLAEMSSVGLGRAVHETMKVACEQMSAVGVRETGHGCEREREEKVRNLCVRVMFC